MEKALKRLQALFEGKSPTPELYDAKLKAMTPEKRKRYLYELGQLAFGYYEKLPKAYKTFIAKYMKHDRVGYTMYLLEHTPMGGLRYTPRFPGLLLKMACFLEIAEFSGRISYLHLAACLFLIFLLPPKIKTIPYLATHLRKLIYLPEDFLRLLGNMSIGGEDYV